ncbi:MAG: hypothetical protein HY821_12555 [Acidobacteria bacterium]|nr:hypothetical protein [Acidobacteriota bacterium]
MNVTVPIPRSIPSVTVSGARLFAHFSYLQVLDVLTTLAFLLAGVQEANPLVRWSMLAFGTPLQGLVAVKMGALLLALLCWWRGRYALLRKANVFFSFLVAWNLFCLILGLASRVRP